MTDMQMNYTTDAMTKKQVYWTEKHMYNTDVQTDLLDRQTDLPERLIQLQTNRITRYRQMNAQCVHYRK